MWSSQVVQPARLQATRLLLPLTEEKTPNSYKELEWLVSLIGPILFEGDSLWLFKKAVLNADVDQVSMPRVPFWGSHPVALLWAG